MKKSKQFDGGVGLSPNLWTCSLQKMSSCLQTATNIFMCNRWDWWLEDEFDACICIATSRRCLWYLNDVFSRREHDGLAKFTSPTWTPPDTAIRCTNTSSNLFDIERSFIDYVLTKKSSLAVDRERKEDRLHYAALAISDTEHVDVSVDWMARDEAQISRKMCQVICSLMNQEKVKTKEKRKGRRTMTMGCFRGLSERPLSLLNSQLDASKVDIASTFSNNTELLAFERE